MIFDVPFGLALFRRPVRGDAGPDGAIVIYGLKGGQYVRYNDKRCPESD